VARLEGWTDYYSFVSLFYQLVARGVIEKTEEEHQNTGSVQNLSHFG
jgi:hypothetical protein